MARPLRLAATMRDLELEPAGDSSAPSIPIESSLRDALSLMLTDGVEELQVTDEGGGTAGRVRLETITSYVGPDGDASSQDEVARA